MSVIGFPMKYEVKRVLEVTFFSGGNRRGTEVPPGGIFSDMLPLAGRLAQGRNKAERTPDRWSFVHLGSLHVCAFSLLDSLRMLLALLQDNYNFENKLNKNYSNSSGFDF